MIDDLFQAGAAGYIPRFYLHCPGRKEGKVISKEMVEIVIRLPKETLKSILDNNNCGIINGDMYKAIYEGIVLPKGHGDLKDADEFDETLKDGEIKARKQRKYILETAINTIRGNLKKADTIIEADKEESEDLECTK